MADNLGIILKILIQMILNNLIITIIVVTVIAGLAKLQILVQLGMIIFLAVMLGMYLRVRQAMIP